MKKTQLMSQNSGVVETIIDMLKFIDVDGETMQHIIEEVGMNDQMLRQLIMNNPESEIKDYLEEKITLSDLRLSSK
jgi:predicted transcriptional regulator